MSYLARATRTHQCLRPGDFGFGSSHDDWGYPMVGDVWRCDDCGTVWAFVAATWWERVFGLACDRWVVSS